MSVDQVAAAAYHEAGHAVAAVLRRAENVVITVDGYGCGLTTFRAKRWDVPFIAYAGPWAEYTWFWDHMPDDMRQGATTVAEYLSLNIFSRDAYADAVELGDWGPGEYPEDVVTYYDDPFGMRSSGHYSEKVWHDHELPRAWPVIERAARAILQGRQVRGEDIEMWSEEVAA